MSRTCDFMKGGEFCMLPATHKIWDDQGKIMWRFCFRHWKEICEKTSINNQTGAAVGRCP